MSHSPSESLCSSALRTGVDMLTGDASGWVFSLGGRIAMADATTMCQLRCEQDANDRNTACAPAKPCVSQPLRGDAAAETSSPVTLNSLCSCASNRDKLLVRPAWLSPFGTANQNRAALLLRGRARDPASRSLQQSSSPCHLIAVSS